MHEKLNKINEKMANALKKKIDAMQQHFNMPVFLFPLKDPNTNDE